MPEAEIMSAEKDPMKVKTQTHVVGEAISFPAASVTAVEVSA
jgi:hypothetical protein